MKNRQKKTEMIAGITLTVIIIVAAIRNLDSRRQDAMTSEDSVKQICTEVRESENEEVPSSVQEEISELQNEEPFATESKESPKSVNEENWMQEIQKGNFSCLKDENPIKAITGIGEFGNREELVTWLDKFSSRPDNVKRRIEDYLEDCNYVAPLLSFQKTNRLPLRDLQKDIPNFVVPRMYYYLDDLELLDYLNNKLEYIGTGIEAGAAYPTDAWLCKGKESD